MSVDSVYVWLRERLEQVTDTDAYMGKPLSDDEKSDLIRRRRLEHDIVKSIMDKARNGDAAGCGIPGKA